PASPNFFSAREAYYAILYEMEDLLKLVNRRLEEAAVLPPPKDIARSIRMARPAWLSVMEFREVLNFRMGVAMRKRLIAVLDELASLTGVAQYAGMVDLYQGVSARIAGFGRLKNETSAGSRQQYAKLDQYGRSYGHGARKTSTARVWMIATDPTLPTARPFEPPIPISPPPSSGPLLTTTILVNSMPLATYFTQVYDREMIIRPLRVTGLLGAFNIFALVQGGGTTGQADAVANGLARAIMGHAPQMKGVLSQAGLLHRDPRVVERKKTGRAKAREGYTWVKR
ncbi:ribosomal protein S5 domain 2-like protein, partial [Calocera viscosa TUFC12733]